MAILRNGQPDSTGAVEGHALGIGSDGAASVVGAGATSVPVNTTVTVTTASTALVAAADADVRGRRIVLFSNSASNPTVYVAIGEAATSSKFPLQAGFSLVSTSLDAVNGLAASSTATVSVIVEQW